MVNLEDKVMVKWNNANKKHYIELGYNFTKIGELFLVKIKDLPRYSGIKIVAVCDICGEKYYPTYKNYMKCHAENEPDCCVHCVSKKAKNTMLQKYGVEHYQQTDECKNRKTQTCISKYGVENPSQLNSIQQKKKETNLIKFGTEWYVQSEQFRELCYEKYGECNPMKNLHIQEKAALSLINNNNVPVSSEEKKMVKLIQSIYGEEKCFPCFPEGKLIFDCMLMLDDIKIDIEYDGFYWHSQRKYQDRKRDEVVKKLGYKVLRVISKGAMPSKEEIIKSVEYLKHQEHSFTKITV